MRLSLRKPLVLPIVGLIFCVSCDFFDGMSHSSPDKADSSDPSPIVASSENLEVSIEEVEYTMRQSLFFAPESVKLLDIQKRLQKPFVQKRAIQQLLHAKRLQQIARREDIEITRRQKEELIEQNPRLQKYSEILDQDKKLPERIRKAGLTKQDLYDVAEELALRKRIARLKVKGLTSNELWEHYLDSHFKIELVTASLSNTPSGSEIDRFVKNNPKRIKNYFENHKDEYVGPPRIVATTLKTTSKSPEEALEKAKKGLTNGKTPDVLAEQLNLELTPKTRIYREQNPEPFRADSKGNSGISETKIRGRYVWQIKEFEKPETPKLTNSIRRSIASELLQQKGILPSVSQRLQKPLDIMTNAGPLNSDTHRLSKNRKQKLIEKLDSRQHLEVKQTGTVKRSKDGRLGKIGLVDNVFEKAFELTPKNPTAQKPVVDRGEAWIFRLTRYDKPSRKAFDKKQQDYRQKLLDQNASKILKQQLAEWKKQNNVTFNLKPLQEKYPLPSKSER